MRHLSLTSAAAAWVMCVAAGSAHATTLGNPLTARTYATDFPPGAEPYDLLVVNNTPLPTGTLDAFLAYNQVSPGGSPTGSAGHSFIGYILRPAGGSQFDVVYDTGVITVSVVAVDTVISYPASFNLQAGDLFAHYGGGIPVDVGGGTDQLYFPTIGPAPLVGSTITLGSGSYPFASQDRTYSIAVEVSTSVPDGGTSFAMLGLGMALLGVARQKLG